MNRWGIPKWLEEDVIARDRTCVYCGIKFLNVVPRNGSRKALATWEHIINDESIKTPKNIALCCTACNSSKGTKKLPDWINSDYCGKKGINKRTVAPIIRKALRGY